MRLLIPLTGALILLSSCQNNMLSVQTEYLSHENLASFRVGTPDPRLRNPPLGQKLIVNWTIPQWNPLVPYELNIIIRFYDGTSFQKTWLIDEAKGTFVFPLLNEEYFARGGFKTYLATLSVDGVVLEEWRHQLWAQLIEITEERGNEEDEEGYGIEAETDQEAYDEHYEGEGAIQRPIEDITDPNQTRFKYYF